MIDVLLFALGFLAGPVIFWVLARQTPTRRYVTALWAVSVALIAGAFVLRQWGGAHGAYGALAVVLLAWLAWITVLSLVMLAIRTSTLPQRPRRIAYGVTAAATTLPWFGLYTAQMIAD
ncbi:hypothetical protein [Roseovarius atlanticus]|uniref:hypothetical protein n=1 Tax=Roseovarius atlanticus TaxID=1641875 RepID=UPI001C971174|nr:hypothetical protein [Roseovarius atlanticus]MBY5986931.1 hypothetical protein [Roseovarius atlanticus]MBY6125571.1 hypothetical protein [Roseovarius atlanticus]MBY6149968.1 hypothetical protein [Roseovarius atlanticus]